MLASLRGLKRDGVRDLTLTAELAWVRDLFFGLHLLSCEDLGLRDAIQGEDHVEATHCRALAEEWMRHIDRDQDLAEDTRGSVPIFSDRKHVTCLWLNLGVRKVPLEVAFAVTPRLAETGERLRCDRFDPARYWLLVQEFAQVQVPGNHTLTRDELRALCNREKTKDAIIKALAKR